MPKRERPGTIIVEQGQHDAVRGDHDVLRLDRATLQTKHLLVRSALRAGASAPIDVDVIGK